MKLREKKVALYAFLLVAAGIGLLIDRTYISRGPSQAAAAIAQRLGAGSDVGDLVMEAPPVAQIFQSLPTPGVPTGLMGTLQAGSAVRDAFGLTPEMRKFYRTKEELMQKQKEMDEARQVEQAKAEEARSSFSDRHQLSGTFLHPTASWAIVDGRVLQIGDEIDGFTLRRVDGYRAVFAQGETVMELELPRATSTKVGPDEKR